MSTDANTSATPRQIKQIKQAACAGIDTIELTEAEADGLLADSAKLAQQYALTTMERVNEFHNTVPEAELVAATAGTDEWRRQSQRAVRTVGLNRAPRAARTHRTPAERKAARRGH